MSSQPFEPRSQPSGSTRFTTLLAEETGLVMENHYADPAMWGRLYREFTLGAIGTGLAAGDYDGDGRVDLYAVSKTEQSRLFRNLGNWRFADVTADAGVAFPAGAWTQGAAFADIDNDGDLDLYVCRFNAANLLFINQGNGTFIEEAAAQGLDVVDGSGMAAFADYDRDGWLDVYLQTNALELEARPTGQPDRLFRNRGDGTFEDVSARAGIGGPTQGHSATWWDFDEDGWPDLYIANDFKDPDTLYRNQRDGTFENVLSYVVPHTPHSSMGADLGDIDNNGHLDLLVADMAATTRVKDHRGMAKLRAGLPEPEVNPLAAPQYMRNALFLNFGVGRMMEAAFQTGLDATDWTWSVLLEDLDLDGRLDAFFTNGMVRELHQADLLDRMLQHESASERYRLMKNSPRLDETNLVFRNLGDLKFEPVAAAWGLDHTGVSFGAVLADFDQDGDLDLVFSNYEAGLTVCRNDSTAGNAVTIALHGTRSNRQGAGARIEIETDQGRQVRELVLSRGYLSSPEPVLHFGLGEAVVVKRLTIRWPSGAVQVLENLPANQRHVVREPAGVDDPIDRGTASPPVFEDVGRSLNLQVAAAERPYPERRRQPLLPIRQMPIGPGVAVADLDGDGRDDLAIGGTTGERGRLLSNMGGGQHLMYGSSLFDDASFTPDAMPLLFELNGDGHADLLVPKGGVGRPPGDAAYRPKAYINRADGRFDPAPEDTLPPIAPSAGPVAAADYDRDGDLDVFLGGRGVPGSYPDPADSFLLRNTGGKLEDVTDALAPALRQAGLVTSALWTDVDGDGWLDLLLTREWDTLLYLHNEGGERLIDRSEEAGFAAAGNGLWHSVAAADFNSDGHLDYAVGNVGLNTHYRASPERPALLYRGTFSGREQIIEAAYSLDGEAVYPMASRDQLLAAIPGLAARFPTFESYATATLEDVVGTDWLNQARRFALTELRSGVFLSDGRGGRQFVALPALAQAAPIDGLAAADVDADGAVDLLFVGNSYAPTPSTSRFDGGIGGWLRGDGRGGFSFVSPGESGLIVAYDGQGLALTDFDENGWPDLLVTRLNLPSLAFRNTAGTGNRSFAVRLAGPAANPTAIGARVTVVWADGRTQTSEIAAGGGYMSQSTSAVFFGYREADPPARLRIRWPDGRTSEHPWHETPRLQINAPAP